MLIMLYDVLIFAPLAIERWLWSYREGVARRNKLRPVPPLNDASGSGGYMEARPDSSARGRFCLLLLAACGERNHNQAVYVLIDTSGTYVREMTKAQVVVNYLLGTLQPG